MNIKTLIVGVAAATALGGAAYALYTLGMQRGLGMASPPVTPASAMASAPPTESGPMSIAQGEEGADAVHQRRLPYCL